MAKNPSSTNKIPRKIIPSPLVVDTNQVLTSLQNFPRGSSPGWSQLRAQHVICGATTPSSQDCLVELTKWLNLLISGRAHTLLAPWLGGAQLTALHKKGNGGFRPIAVGDTFRRLASRLCMLFCCSYKSL